MRATTGTAWLLLALSLLCHSVFSDGPSTAATLTKSDSSTVVGTTLKNQANMETTKPAVSTNLTTQTTKVPNITTAPNQVEKTTGSQETGAKTSKAVTNGDPLKGGNTQKTVTQVVTTIQQSTNPTPTSTTPDKAAESGAPSSTAKNAVALSSPNAMGNTTPAGASTSASANAGTGTGAGTGASSVAGVTPNKTGLTTLASAVMGLSITTTPPGVIMPSKSQASITPEGNAPSINVTKDSLTSTTYKPPTNPDNQSTAQTVNTALSGGGVDSQQATDSVRPTSTGAITIKSSTWVLPGPTGTPSPTLRPKSSKAQPSGTTAGSVFSISTTDKDLQKFLYSLNRGQKEDEEENSHLVKVCKKLMVNIKDGNCTVFWRHQNNKMHLDSVEINGKVKTELASQFYEEFAKKPTDKKTLIAILASCGALLIMIVILAVCASHHRRPYSENQQHLTEELHTVENGYHDNPTLEVMEVQPEMQEKKTAMNGEFNDNWIVPIDNLLKDDIPDEEDTHL